MSSSNGAGLRVLTGERRREAERIIAKYPNSRSATLPLLFLVQSVEGHVTDEGMRDVADLLGLTPAQVLASASFYTMLKKRPQGDYLISVCRNLSCTHMGGRRIATALERRLGISAGQTTANGKFTLETAECLATCDGAPSMQINYEDFYKMTPESAVDLVDRIERGEVILSVRGEPVKTSKAISHETATAGLRVPGSAGDHSARTIGGEIPRPDTAPGWRRPVTGEPSDGGAGA